jgi:hypothetical protein
MTMTDQTPRSLPARRSSPTATNAPPRPGTGLSAAEIRQIVLDILG